LREAASADNPQPVLAACLATVVSLRNFWIPWPGPETRAQIATPLDGVKFAACWVDARVKFLECLVGTRQKWEMFAPSVDKSLTQVRARLFYDDDSEMIVHQGAEPPDLTHGGHGLFEERILSYEVYTQNDLLKSAGYCNLLAHRHPRNANGAKLVCIVLFCVWVDMPEPGVDALAHYQEQNRRIVTAPRLPGWYRSDSSRAVSWQVLPDYYMYDAVKGVGWPIDDDSP
jgi:hypothetical protein